MRAVVAGSALDAERLHELLAVVRELVDDVVPVLDDPDVLLGIVRIHRHRVRPPEQRVPLRPVLGYGPVRIDDDNAMLPAGVDTELAFPSVPAVRSLIAGAGDGTHRGIAPGRLRDRE